MTALSLGQRGGKRDPPSQNSVIGRPVCETQLISPVCLSWSQTSGENVHADERSAVLSLPPPYAGWKVTVLHLKGFFKHGKKEVWEKQPGYLEPGSPADAKQTQQSWELVRFDQERWKDGRMGFLSSFPSIPHFRKRFQNDFRRSQCQASQKENGSPKLFLALNVQHLLRPDLWCCRNLMLL